MPFFLQMLKTVIDDLVTVVKSPLVKVKAQTRSQSKTNYMLHSVGKTFDTIYDLLKATTRVLKAFKTP